MEGEQLEGDADFRVGPWWQIGPTKPPAFARLIEVYELAAASPLIEAEQT